MIKLMFEDDKNKYDFLDAVEFYVDMVPYTDTVGRIDEDMVDPNEPMLKDGKYHPRDLSKTKAYEQVPTMLPIKSDVDLRKAKSAIQYVVLRKIFKF